MFNRPFYHASLLATVAMAFFALVVNAVGQESIPNPFDYVGDGLPKSTSTSESTPTAKLVDEQLNALPKVSAPLDQAEIQVEPIADLPNPPEIDRSLQAEDAAQADEPPQPEVVLPANREPEVPRDQLGVQVGGAREERRQGPDALLNAKYGKALVISVEGPIFGRFHWYLNNRLDLARRQSVDLVIVRITSPGGDLEQSLQLARRLRDIEWATTIAYVPEEAISGGAIICLGADRIIMERGALIGDAGPIRMGLDGQFEHAEEKIVSYLASAIRELAIAKDRPAAVAEAMVDRSLTVFSATELSTGKDTFLTEKETEDPEVLTKYEIGKPLPETGQNRFLTVAAARAEQLQLCEGVFASQEDLLASLSVGTVEFTRMNWVDRTVYLLNRPWLTALLLIIGLVGLYLELIAPGISVAGLTACCCFGIFFWSHALGGTSGWLEVLLFVLGILCVICEMFVVPGFGVFGITGICLVVLSLVMASQDFLIPSNAVEWTQLQTNSLIVLGAVLGVLLLFVGQVLLLDSLPGLNRFRLSAPDNAMLATSGTEFSGGGISLASGVSQANLPPIGLGEQGVADSDLRPSGKILLNERLVDVVTEGDYVDAGSNVEVIRVEGNRIVVRKL